MDDANKRIYILLPFCLLLIISTIGIIIYVACDDKKKRKRTCNIDEDLKTLMPDSDITKWLKLLGKLENTKCSLSLKKAIEDRFIT